MSSPTETRHHRGHPTRGREITLAPGTYNASNSITGEVTSYVVPLGDDTIGASSTYTDANNMNYTWDWVNQVWIQDKPSI